jgi:hypothetical protein
MRKYRVPWGFEVMHKGMRHHVWVGKGFASIHICSAESDVLQLSFPVYFPTIGIYFGKRILSFVYT